MLQLDINPRCGWVRATEHAPCDPFRVLERRHGLTDIIERGVVVLIERLRVYIDWTTTGRFQQNLGTI